ncbi:MAG: hypothetical protein R3D98_12095 [Candidatus Krumholzibacteriia bacterium]
MNLQHSTTKFMLVALVLGGLVGAALAQGEPVEVRFGWTGCPTHDQDGNACAAAVVYEVYLQKGGAEAVKVAEVENDTTFTLIAERGVVQRVRVVGYDVAGRPSEPSEWSDPIYFEIERGAENPLGPPPTAATLRKNYPNPFNPETAIVYGVPANLPGDAAVALEIYNLRGQRIRTFGVDTTPGWHEVTWNGLDDGGRPQATGTYVTRYICGDRVEVGKMTMVK